MRRTCSRTRWILTGAALDRTLVGKDLHPIDQGDDPIGLVADQPRQGAILGRAALFEQLGGAAYSRQRIFHLMGEDGGHGGHRPCRIAVAQLMADLERDGLFVQRDDHPAIHLDQRRNLNVHCPVAGARAVENHAVFGDIGRLGAGLFDQGEQAGNRAAAIPSEPGRTDGWRSIRTIARHAALTCWMQPSSLSTRMAAVRAFSTAVGSIWVLVARRRRKANLRLMLPTVATSGS